MPEQAAEATLADRLLLASGVVLFAIGQSLNFIIVAPMARSVGLTEQQFGLAYTIASLPLIFSAPFWGRRSDRIGRKPVFVIGLMGSAIGNALLGLTLSGGMTGLLTLPALLICITASRALYGMTASAINPVAAAYMADVTTSANRARGMALIGSANSIGSILGPLLAAGLAFAGTLLPMFVAAGLCLFGALAAVLLLHEPVHHADQVRHGSKLALRDSRLRPFLIIWGCFFLVFISLNLITAFYIEDRLGITDERIIIRTASIALVSMAGVITIVQGVILQLWRVSPRILFRLCGPAFCAALLLLAAAQSLWMLMAGYALIGLALSFATPGIRGSASLAVTARDQGTAAGYLSAASTIGAIAAPLFGTTLYDIAPVAPFLFGAGLFLMISLYAFTVEVDKEAPV